MKSCFFCGTDACTCTDKILERYLYLTDLQIKLKQYHSKNSLTGTELAAWHWSNDNVKEEQRKIKLLITYEPYKKKSKRKRISQ